MEAVRARKSHGGFRTKAFQTDGAFYVASLLFILRCNGISWPPLFDSRTKQLMSPFLPVLNLARLAAVVDGLAPSARVESASCQGPGTRTVGALFLVSCLTWLYLAKYSLFG